MIQIGVDIGGTFTDIVLLRDDRLLQHTKVPSTPGDLIAGVRRGVEKILSVSGLRASEVTRFVHGTTVAINALLERKGAVTGVLMTKGFEDTLEIGRQKRSRMYELFLEPETPAFLAPRRRRIGITERIAADGSVVQPLDEGEVRMAARHLVTRHGVTAISVCYLFSFRNPFHERRTRDLIEKEFPNVRVSISSEVDPIFREYERLVVTTLDAYLQDAVGDYVQRLAGTLRETGFRAELQVMQSRGGITSANAIARRPVSLLLSGLAAGVVGSRFVASNSGHNDIISLDMGGTSCDIALVKAGKPIVTNQTQIAGFPLRMQMIDVSTIGAGGGSIAWADDAGGLRVGPQSAGADPGPACYAQGGKDATVTDASLVLGYLNPANFAAGELALDRKAAESALEQLARKLGLDLIATAAGIHRIVNAKMADEIRRVSVQRGYDPRQFSLLPLGGAGPVNGGALAIELGIPRVVVPDTPGVLSAFGLLVANVEHDQMETFAKRADQVERPEFRRLLDKLNAQGKEKMRRDGVPMEKIEVHEYADMRYVGQSYELTIDLPSAVESQIRGAVSAFHEYHHGLYGHSNPSAQVEFVNLRTVHVYKLPSPDIIGERHSSTAAPRERRRAFFQALGKFADTPIYERGRLGAGQVLPGPAIVEQADTTLVVYPGQRAHVHPSGSIILELEGHGA